MDMGQWACLPSCPPACYCWQRQPCVFSRIRQCLCLRCAATLGNMAMLPLAMPPPEPVACLPVWSGLARPAPADAALEEWGQAMEEGDWETAWHVFETAYPVDSEDFPSLEELQVKLALHCSGGVGGRTQWSSCRRHWPPQHVCSCAVASLLCAAESRCLRCCWLCHRHRPCSCHRCHHCCCCCCCCHHCHQRCCGCCDC